MVSTHLDAILAAFGAVDGLHLLDIGCGDSALARELAAAGADVTGIDPFMPACDWQTVGGGRWRLLRNSAEALPLDDATIDGVLFIYSLHHVPAPLHASALAEARRVLKPGGQLYVAEPLAEGAFNDVLRVFHDEAHVRAEAQASLAAAATHFARRTSTGYLSRSRYDDFSAFATRMQANVRFNPYTAEDVVAPAVRDRFAAVFARTAGIFDQPVKVDIFA